MPIDFSKLEADSIAPTTIKRYQFAIDSGFTLSDPWDPRFSFVHPAGINNSPIVIRLATTNITENATWTTRDGTNPYGSDAYFTSVNQIPTLLGRIREIINPNPPFSDISDDRPNEVSSGSTNAGGIGVSGAGIIYSLIDTTAFAGVTIDIISLLNKFVSFAGNCGGITMSLILHGQNELSSATGEYKYVLGSSTYNGVAGHNKDFYKTSAYLTFKSNSNLGIPTLTSSNISFRNTFHHVGITFGINDYTGITMRAAPISGIGSATIYFNNTRLSEAFNTAAALGKTLTINSYLNEVVSASKYSGSAAIPNSVICTNKTVLCAIVAADSINISYNATTVSAYSLFDNTPNSYYLGLNTDGIVTPTNSTTNPFSGIATRYNHTPPATIFNVRVLNPVVVGSSGRYLAIESTSAADRFFGGTSPTSITAGSYIRISNAGINNGIYQVIETFDGILNDIASNKFVSGGLSQYQYLKLSRDIIQANSGSSITIENISTLPILHIKYRQTITT